MDAYHKVLVKLYEATGGRESHAVDFKELVKAEGFLGNYEDVFQKLSAQGWIAETPKENYVTITHWGVKEAQKSASGVTDADTAQEISKTSNLLNGGAREFLALLEEFQSDASKENFGRVEKKFDELKTAMDKLRESI